MNDATRVVVDVVVFSTGVVAVAATLLSAVRTIVLPHGRSARLSRWLFLAARRVVALRNRAPMGEHRRRRMWSLYAPTVLVLLPLVWMTTALAGFTAMFWALDTHPLRAAYKLAGSSMLTLGFANVDDLPRLTVSLVAAALTISIFALLLVTYLPTMYQAYSERETALTALETFAGEPPDPAEFLVRYHRIGASDQLSDVWRRWRETMFDLRESHTALPAVVLFQSSSPDRDWVQAVEAVLDSAALYNSVCVVDEDPDASLCLRAGWLALADIADFFDLEIPLDPEPDDPISVDREVFESLRRRIVDAGIDAPVDPDTAWTRWHGWRVNYDRSIAVLASLTNARTTHDRS